MTTTRSPAPTGAAATPAQVAEERVLLGEEREFLLGSLRDLEREHGAGDLDGDDYQALKDGYTSRAAEVIRALDALSAKAKPARRGAARNTRVGGAASSPRGPVVAAPRAGRRGRTLGAVAATLLLAVVAGWLVTRSSTQRLPGQSSSGGPPVRGTAPAASDALAAAAADPTASAKVIAAVAEAQKVVFNQATDPLPALRLLDAALKETPDNPTALSWQGFLLFTTAAQIRDAAQETSRVALVDKAFVKVDRAIQVDPSYNFAHFFRGIMLNQGRNDPAGAVTEFRTFLALKPPPGMQQAAEKFLDDALAAAGGTVPTTTFAGTTP